MTSSKTQDIDTMKFDLGKCQAGIMEDFLPAIKAVIEHGSKNNKPHGKYERGSWLLVENAEERYKDAFWRHALDGMYNIDKETGSPHIVAMAWNLLALITFMERNK